MLEPVVRETRRRSDLLDRRLAFLSLVKFGEADVLLGVSDPSAF